MTPGMLGAPALDTAGEAIETGYAESEEKGIEQGIEQERKQVIARLRELGVDESIIAQAVDSE